MSAYKTIYVTGAPASGKSSTMALLNLKVPGLNIWEYGSRLTEFLQKRGEDLADQAALRAQSAGVCTPDDINRLDEELLAWTANSRVRGHTVIDSHPVTKEQYGFRVTAFSANKFRQLAPDEIWLFYVPPEVTLSRISKDPKGRPLISLEEARMHSVMQASAACTFAIAAGCPIYMFDTNTNQELLIDLLVTRLGS